MHQAHLNKWTNLPLIATWYDQHYVSERDKACLRNNIQAEAWWLELVGRN